VEKVIDTSEVKSKLNAKPIGIYHIDEFCRLLANRLNSQVTPLGFLMAFELMKLDVEKGIDGFTGKRIDSPIAGLGIGGVIQLTMIKIAEKVLPEDFCNDVKAEWQACLRDAG
jgi:hypothetical protein